VEQAVIANLPAVLVIVAALVAGYRWWVSS
jgi:hypothetical protein